MSTTALLSEQKIMLWRIPNFAEVRKSETLLKEQVYKFEISVGVTQDASTLLKWKCFLISSVNEGTRHEGHIGLFVAPKNLPSELVKSHARFRIQIDDQKTGGHYFNRAFRVRVQELFDGGNCRGICKMLPLVSQDTPFLTADGTLEILVTAKIYFPEVQNAELASLEAEFKEKFYQTLQWQLPVIHGVAKNVTSRDVKIVSKDGIAIPVDCILLSLRSLVFLKLFESDRSENQTRVLQINDMDSKSLEVLLHFIQAGELRSDWRNEGVIEGLVYGAHKFMLHDLQDFLDRALGLVCTNRNCGKLMGLAKAFGWNKAERQLLDYFKENMLQNMEEVLKFAENTAAGTAMASTLESENWVEIKSSTKEEQIKVN